MGGQEILVIVILLGCLPILGLWVWSLIHCIQNKNLSDTNRVLGIVLIALLGIIGSLVYLFIPRENNTHK